MAAATSITKPKPNSDEEKKKKVSQDLQYQFRVQRPYVKEAQAESRDQMKSDFGRFCTVLDMNYAIAKRLIKEFGCKIPAPTLFATTGYDFEYGEDNCILLLLFQFEAQYMVQPRLMEHWICFNNKDNAGILGGGQLLAEFSGFSQLRCGWSSIWTHCRPVVPARERVKWIREFFEQEYLPALETLGLTRLFKRYFMITYNGALQARDILKAELEKKGGGSLAATPTASRTQAQTSQEVREWTKTDFRFDSRVQLPCVKETKSEPRREMISCFEKLCDRIGMNYWTGKTLKTKYRCTIVDPTPFKSTGYAVEFGEDNCVLCILFGFEVQWMVQSRLTERWIGRLHSKAQVLFDSAGFTQLTDEWRALWMTPGAAYVPPPRRVAIIRNFFQGEYLPALEELGLTRLFKRDLQSALTAATGMHNSLMSLYGMMSDSVLPMPLSGSAAWAVAGAAPPPPASSATSSSSSSSSSAASSAAVVMQK